MFSNPFVFVVESFVLSLIPPSVRHDPNLVPNPIIVFTALDLAMVLENRRSAKPTSGHNSPPLINTLHEFFFKFLAVRFRSIFRRSRKKDGVDVGYMFASFHLLRARLFVQSIAITVQTEDFLCKGKKTQEFDERSGKCYSRHLENY